MDRPPPPREDPHRSLRRRRRRRCCFQFACWQEVQATPWSYTQLNLVVVSSPELAKEVLHRQGVEFGSRTRNIVSDIFTGKGQLQDMVFTVYGEHWRKMRRVMTVPVFTNKVVQHCSSKPMAGRQRRRRWWRT